MSKEPRRGSGARAKATKKEEKVEVKVEKELPPKELPPKGPAPNAVVQARHIREVMERQARGFSLGELSVAGLAFQKAKNWKVSLDIRRRSVLDGNVTKLKSWLQTRKVPKIEKPAEPVKPKEEKPKKQRKKSAPRRSTKKKEKAV